MAILLQKPFSIEIIFKPYSSGYLKYGLKLLCDNKSLINPSLLTHKTINFYSYKEDTLIPFLESLIKKIKIIHLNP